MSTVCCPYRCISTAQFRVFLLILFCAPIFCTSSVLSIFLTNVFQKFLFQQAPNSHLWLIPSHSGMFLALPCRENFLRGFLFYPHFFDDLCLFLCDSLIPLHSQTYDSFLFFVHFLFDLSLHSSDIPYHPQ
jgi:hypothetical protein